MHRFVDKSVAQAWATLLDEGTHLCSQSSMHRILRANHAAENDVRRHSTRPARSGIRSRPGPVRCGARTAPKLRGPQRGVYFELYVILDIFSRYVVAWTVAAREDSLIARELRQHAMGVHGIPDVIHADRGTSMTSKPVSQLLVDLTVTRSNSRPRVSNDNPYSESQFKTLEYCPAFPQASAAWLTPAPSVSSSSATTPRASPRRDWAAQPAPRSTTMRWRLPSQCHRNVAKRGTGCA